eukprot:TRINITY_DN12601_c0_g1_i3.p1 TRINITY_DN12601_c0_g1~~TRINITY_DN12601_c0_g1_i3.p1  ORF type:complete len:430 (+),score=95.65 TRINITY_DN12601_c0_g1_i3:43-1332(+)
MAAGSGAEAASAACFADPVTFGAQEADRGSFELQGFQRFDGLLSKTFVDELNGALDRVMNGDFESGVAPDKLDAAQAASALRAPAPAPAATAATPAARARGGALEATARVVHLINIWHADSAFARLVLSPALGTTVASLAGWRTGARVAQDQVWAKPPGSAPLVFHRDSPYFFFDSDEDPAAPSVMTAWVALDDMAEELGPLEYVVGSHRWSVGRAGSASAFFQQSQREQLLAAAAQAGLSESDLQIVSMRGLEAGGVAIHHGCCWHGSASNLSPSRPRRGIGIHFVPGSARFTEAARKSKLWSPYIDVDGLLPNELLFPVVTRAPSALAAPVGSGGGNDEELRTQALRKMLEARRRAANAGGRAGDGAGIPPQELSKFEKKRLGHFINNHRAEWNAFVLALGEKPNFSYKTCSRQRLVEFHAEAWQDT